MIVEQCVPGKAHLDMLDDTFVWDFMLMNEYFCLIIGN